MARTRIVFLLFFSVVLAACSSLVTTSSEEVETSEVSEDAGSDQGTTGETGPTAPEQETDGETAPAAPFVVDGEKTTFVPELDGPFNLDGGITFDTASTEGVIIEADPDSPLQDTYQIWPTDWTRRTVEDWNEFGAGLSSSDPRDGIPPIDTPVFESAALAAEWLGPREPGALVQLDDEVRFYPLSILTRHEIVNDAFGDVPVAVTFCPLCNTAIAFDRRVNGEVLRFGVSGLLRNSDLVMWDDQTTSLWQQITGDGVVGTYAGAELETIPTSIVSFQQFAENFPDGLSLAAESAAGRQSYGINPYAGYSSSPQPFLFSGDVDGRLEPLSRVIGVTQDGAVAGYSFARAQAEGAINDEVDGVPIVVFHAGDTADALDQAAISVSAAIGSAVAHSPVVNGETLTFSANGDGTFTDEQTGSTWSVVGLATDGELAGTQLDFVEHRNEFWFAWQAFFGPENLREG